MNHMNYSVKISAPKDEVLRTLRVNLETHKKLVADARGGYIQAAKAELEKKLAQLTEGKAVSLLTNLRPPKDYSNEYETVIKMLELHTGDTIELGNDEVRCLIEDNWQWMTDFFTLNSTYSSDTRALARSKGYGWDE